MKRSVAVAILAMVAIVHPPLAAQEAECPAEAATRAYRSGDFERAAELFARAVRCGDGEPGLHYDAACAQALAGQREAAFQSLEAAVDLGFVNAELLAGDADLASLHDDPRWPALLEAVAQGRRSFGKIWDGAVFATAYREDLPLDEKLAGLSRVWAEARSSFAYFDQVPDLDWDGAFLEWLPRVRRTRSTFEYYRELQALVARLRDGHTRVDPPEEIRDQFDARPPVETRRIEGRVLVTAVLDPRLEAAGVVAGLEIVAIDGEAAELYAERAVRPYQSASTPQDLEARVYQEGLLRGAEGSRVRLLLADSENARHEVELERWSRRRLRDAAPARPIFEATPLGERMLRIDLRSFNSTRVVEEWNAHWDEIAGARGLVLDLRENGGGNSGNGYAILATLVARPFATSAWRTRLYRPSHRAWGRGEAWYVAPGGEWASDPDRHFDGPVVVLIGPRTYSAAEDFLVAFDTAARGALVGEPSGGSTGQPLGVSLPGGGSARFCAKRDTYPDGREFVGIGIQPARRVTPTVADLRSGRDATLAVAVDLLRESLAAAGGRF